MSMQIVFQDLGTRPLELKQGLARVESTIAEHKRPRGNVLVLAKLADALESSRKNSRRYHHRGRPGATCNLAPGQYVACE